MRESELGATAASRCLPPPNDAVSFVIGSVGSGGGGTAVTRVRS